jgi:hypothetical protein
MQTDEQDQGNEELVGFCFHRKTSFVNSLLCAELQSSIFRATAARRRAVVPFISLQKEIARNRAEFLEVFSKLLELADFSPRRRVPHAHPPGPIGGDQHLAIL